MSYKDPADERAAKRRWRTAHLDRERARRRSFIEAGEGIMAGLSISCQKVLSFRYRLFAGTCTWKLASDAERTVTCSRLEGGEVAYGILNETAAPALSPTKGAASDA